MIDDYDEIAHPEGRRPPNDPEPDGEPGDNLPDREEEKVPLTHRFAAYLA